MNRFEGSFKPVKKYLSTCLLGIAALLGGASPGWAQVSLGAASEFAVLGGTAVTCTAGVVTGDVGVSPGIAFTNTGCTIAGRTPPATNAAAVLARTDFLIAYAALAAVSCEHTISVAAFTDDVPALEPLAPGVYCFPAAVTFTRTTLTLDGPANGIWVFKVGAGLTGTGFSVVMANGAQARNVFWAPSGAATMTDSAFKGNILAGDAAIGSITLTRGTFAGRALANVAVSMTGAGVIGCGALSGSSSC